MYDNHYIRLISGCSGAGYVQIQVVVRATSLNSKEAGEQLTMR